MAGANGLGCMGVSSWPVTKRTLRSFRPFVRLGLDSKTRSWSIMRNSS
ncbi:hypothetical protein chiPu_0024649, partial [Chiloscyllium punctatum]|nr:hypothetical protein [Chiloscyllium punctatum]